MDQIGPAGPLPEILPEVADHICLFRRITDLLFSFFRLFQRRSEDLFALDGQNSLLFQRPDDRQGNIQFLRHQIIFQQMVVQKGRHQPGPGFLVLLQIVMKLPQSGLFIKKQPEPFLHFRIFLMPDGEHRLQRLDHSPAIVFFHPRSQSHQLRLNLHAPLRDFRNLFYF